MIELKPEHAASLAALLNSQAGQIREQAAATLLSAQAIEAMAGKVSDGGRELTNTEIRLLADLLRGFENLPGVFLGLQPEAAQALFSDLRTQLDAANAKRSH